MTDNNQLANLWPQPPQETLEAKKASLRETLSHVSPSDLDNVGMVAESLKPRSADEYDYRSVFVEWGKQGGHRRSKLIGIWNRAKPDPEAFQELIERSQSAAHDGLMTRNFADVKEKAIRYVWPGWLAKGYLNLVAGETGAAKSTVIADLVARVTSGAPFPGQPADARRTPGRVLWSGSEDGAEELTVPRLKACGAILANVTEIQGTVRYGERAMFSLQDDIANVEALLKQAKNDRRPYDVLVLDPLTAYLSGQYLRRVDLRDAGHIRAVLTPWFDLAQKYKLCIIGITHFMKDETRSMLHRVLGSQAFAAVSRSVIVLADMKLEDSPHFKAMLQAKTNLPERPEGAWVFYTEMMQVGVDGDDGTPIHATRPHWERLDRLLTSETLIGKKAGPKSVAPALFVQWIWQQFANVPPNEGKRVSDVKAEALRLHVVPSEAWWDKHSSEYLDKQNINGVYWCRPKTVTSTTSSSG